MDSVFIGVADEIDVLRDRLSTEFQALENEGVRVRIEESNRGHLTFLGCNFGLTDSNPQKRDLQILSRHSIANALSDVIVNRWEDRLLRRLIRLHYGYFDREEQSQILHYACQYLAPETEEQRLEQRTLRKSRILSRLAEYLELNDELILDGFITFRLKDYVEELEEAVDQAVDDFLMEREYAEFVRLLRYFAEVQEPRVPMVHVQIRAEGRFKLLDQDGEAVNSEYLDEYVVEMADSGIDYEDLLISALITMAPERILVHRGEGRGETIQTLERIFGGRIIRCRGCSLCEH